ncbi:hypothetical protein MNBD_PLANCTO03-664 [hydrothermal vent metagenome]|uniref:Uncharacterized protein n=1 Tax=hydrothermal vent metagenome TaxID=652676 RepID=A0A3B1DMB4_9ZZZZ
MPEITRLSIQLSLVVTPPADRLRDGFTMEQRLSHLDEALLAVRELALFWPSERGTDSSDASRLRLQRPAGTGPTAAQTTRTKAHN